MRTSILTALIASLGLASRPFAGATDASPCDGKQDVVVTAPETELAIRIALRLAGWATGRRWVAAEYEPILVSLSTGAPLLIALQALAQAESACEEKSGVVVAVLDAGPAIEKAQGFGPQVVAGGGAPADDASVIRPTPRPSPGLKCRPGASHCVVLYWVASASPNVVGYNVYRSLSPDGPYAKLTPVPLAGLVCMDNAVQSGSTYYYVATAVDDQGNESSYSNQAQAVIPAP